MHETYEVSQFSQCEKGNSELCQRLLRKKAALPFSSTAGNPGNVLGKFFGFGRYVHWDLITVQPD